MRQSKTLKQFTNADKDCKKHCSPCRKPENRFLCDAAHALLLAYQKQVIKAYYPYEILSFLFNFD